MNRLNKSTEQAKFVQDALRAGKSVAVAVPRERLFRRVVEAMIPEDLEIIPFRPNRHVIRFKNGATLAFIPSVMGDRGVRGARFDLALYYPSIYGEFAIDRERMRECYDILREHAKDFRELEMP